MPIFYKPGDEASKEDAKKQALLRAKLNKQPQAAAETPLSREEDPDTGLRGGAPADLQEPPKPAQPGYIPTPDAALDRNLIRQIKSSYDQPENRMDIDKLMKKQTELESRLAPTSPEMQKIAAPYESAMSDIKKQITGLQSRKERASNLADYGEIAELFTNALTQYAAGLYGLKHGVDMSGVRFNKTDWQGRLKNQLDVLNNQISSLESGGQSLEKQQEQEQGRFQDAAKERMALEIQAEKERAAGSREANSRAISAAVQLMRASAAQKQREQAASQQLLRQGTAEALKNQAELIKKAEIEEAGLKEAIQIMGDEKVKKADKEKMLDRALGKTGVNPADVAGQEKPWYQFWGDSDDNMKINFLQTQLKKAQEQTKQLRDDRLSIASGHKPEAAPSAAPAATGPQPGDVEDGMRFLGGDPSKAENWEQVE